MEHFAAYSWRKNAHQKVFTSGLEDYLIVFKMSLVVKKMPANLPWHNIILSCVCIWAGIRKGKSVHMHLYSPSTHLSLSIVYGGGVYKIHISTRVV